MVFRAHDPAIVNFGACHVGMNLDPAGHYYTAGSIQDIGKSIVLLQPALPFNDVTILDVNVLNVPADSIGRIKDLPVGNS
jgi:hypothetical protein